MFKRFTAILAFVLATIGLSTAAHARSDEVMGFITWDAEAAQAAINNGEQVVVNVWAEWCPSCIAQRRTLHAVLQQNPDAFADVKVFAINIDDRPRPQQVGSHRISGSAARTTLIFFNGGEEIAVYGGQQANQIADLLSF